MRIFGGATGSLAALIAAAILMAVPSSAGQLSISPLEVARPVGADDVSKRIVVAKRVPRRNRIMLIDLSERELRTRPELRRAGAAGSQRPKQRGNVGR